MLLTVLSRGDESLWLLLLEAKELSEASADAAVLAFAVVTSTQHRRSLVTSTRAREPDRACAELEGSQVGFRVEVGRSHVCLRVYE